MGLQELDMTERLSTEHLQGWYSRVNAFYSYHLTDENFLLSDNPDESSGVSARQRFPARVRTDHLYLT